MSTRVRIAAFILLLSLIPALASCGKVPSDEGEGGTNPRASRLDDIAMTTTEPYSFYAGDSLADKNQTNIIRGVFSYEEAELAYRRMSENCNTNTPFVAFDYEDDEVFPIFWFFGIYKEGTTADDIKNKPFYELEYSWWYTMTGLYYKDVYTSKEDHWGFVDSYLKCYNKHFVAKAEFYYMYPDTQKHKTPNLTVDDIFLSQPTGGYPTRQINGGYSNGLHYKTYESTETYEGPAVRLILEIDSYDPFTEEYFNKIKHTFKMIVLPYEKH